MLIKKTINTLQEQKKPIFVAKCAIFSIKLIKLKTIKMKKTALLFSASLMSFAITAQDSAATKAAVAPAEAAAPVEKKSFPLEISGSVDAYYRTNITSANTDTATAGRMTAPGTSFANQNGFALGMANLIIQKNGEKAGFVADLVFGQRGTDAVFNSVGSASIVNQLYAYWNVSDKVTLTMGNFNTFLGYEVISPVGNFNYSTSYAFSYGPFSHTGLKADFQLTDNFSAMLAVLNATDFTEMNPVGTFSLGAQLGYENETGGAWLNVLTGDQDGQPLLDSGMVDLTAASMLQVDLTTGWNVTDDIYVGLNATINQMKSNDTIDAGSEVGQEVPAPIFSGVALYLQYSFSDAFALGLRGEYFAEDHVTFDATGNLERGAGAIGGYDADGYATIGDITLSAKINRGNLSIIPEVRVDIASEKIFMDSDYKSNETLASFVLAAVYSF